MVTVPCLMLAAGIATGAALPTSLPPGHIPAAGEDACTQGTELRLELVINQTPTGRILPVRMQDSHVWLAVQDLRAGGLLLADATPAMVDVSMLPGMTVQYDEVGQRLLLQVESRWLPERILGTGRATTRVQAESSTGALLNYELYVDHRAGGASTLSLWNEARLFGPFGLLSASGAYRTSLAGAPVQQGYIRYDSTFTHIDDGQARTWEAGDFVTRTLAWSSPARLGGVQISRDFSVRPDIVTYPLPSFSAVADLPTSLELFINGYRASQQDVLPGPFTLTDIPHVNGAGEAVVVTTDAQGRRISIASPFYVASQLLRPGLSDYAVALGVLRKDYGRKSFSYGEAVASVAWRQGITRHVTLEATAQGAENLALGGVGALFRIGNLGVVDGAFAYSKAAGSSGSQTRIGYQYQGRRWNLMASHMRRSRDFRDLSGLGHAGADLPRRQTQAQASMTLPRHVGTLGVSYLSTRQRNENFRILGLAYQKPVGSGSLYVSLNRDLERAGTTAMLQLTVPLGAGMAVAAIEQAPGGRVRARADYSRAIPADGGLGWTIGARKDASHAPYVQGNLGWRTTVARLDMGLTGAPGQQMQWASVGGSLIWMDGAMFPANRVQDSFGLISTDGVADVPVRYENRVIGTTDRRGHLLVPWVPGYYAAKYAIDPLDLPATMRTPLVEQRVAVARGGGRLIRFPLQQTAAISLTLQGPDGTALPPGTPVTVNGKDGFHVGYEGILYVEEPLAANKLVAALADGTTCRASFVLDLGKQTVTREEPVTCRP